MKRFEIHGAGEGVPMKNPIKIKQSSSFISVKLIQNNLTIK